MSDVDDYDDGADVAQVEAIRAATQAKLEAARRARQEEEERARVRGPWCRLGPDWPSKRGVGGLPPPYPPVSQVYSSFICLVISKSWGTPAFPAPGSPLRLYRRDATCHAAFV